MKRDTEVEAAVAWLQEAGVAGPAFLLLQGFRPLASLGGHSLIFLQPLLLNARWRQAVGRLAGVLTDRSRLEIFLSSLEACLRDSKESEHEERTR